MNSDSEIELVADSSQIQALKAETEQVDEGQPKIVLDLSDKEMSLKTIFKIMERNCSRHFMKRLMFSYIYSLKNHQKSITHVSPNINWKYKNLVEKSTRTEEEEQMLQFLNLCATMIQSKFKAYITQKRHKIAMSKVKKSQEKLLAFFKMWKVSRVFNCKKCFLERAEIKIIHFKLETELDNWTTRDSKKIQQLQKFYDLKTSMFRDSFYLLQNSGMWVLQQNMKPKKIPIIKTNLKVKSKKKLESNSLENKNILIQNDLAHFETTENDIGSFEKNQSTFSSFEEDRPIKAKGQYVIIESETPSQDFANPKNERMEQGKKEQKQQFKKKQKRQKYDPRKAIQEQKRRKKVEMEMQEKRETNVSQNQIIAKMRTEEQTGPEKQIQQEGGFTTVEKQIKIKRKSKSKQKKQNSLNTSLLEKNKIKTKKVESKVNCWINKKEEQADWVKQCKMRLKKQRQERLQEENQISSHQQVSFQSKNNQKAKRQEGNYGDSQKQKKIIIEDLMSKHNEIAVTRKQSVKNLKQEMINYVQRNALKRKENHRTIEQLQDAHSKHYGDRFQNLIPKLNLLSIAREENRQSWIPVIDSDSEELLQWFHCVFNSAQFWNFATQLEKVYKSFSLQ